MGSPQAPRSSEGQRSLDRAPGLNLADPLPGQAESFPTSLRARGWVRAEVQPRIFRSRRSRATSILLGSVMDVLSVASEGLDRLTSRGDNAEADFS